MEVTAELLARKWPQSIVSVRIRKRGLFGIRTKRRIYYGNERGWYDSRTKLLAAGKVKAAINRVYKTSRR